MENYENPAVKIEVTLKDGTVMKLTGEDARICWNRIDIAEWIHWGSNHKDYKPLDWKTVE